MFVLPDLRLRDIPLLTFELGRHPRSITPEANSVSFSRWLGGGTGDFTCDNFVSACAPKKHEKGVEGLVSSPESPLISMNVSPIETRRLQINSILGVSQLGQIVDKLVESAQHQNRWSAT